MFVVVTTERREKKGSGAFAISKCSEASTPSPVDGLGILLISYSTQVLNTQISFVTAIYCSMVSEIIPRLSHEVQNWALSSLYRSALA